MTVRGFFSGLPLFGKDGFPSARQILGTLAFIQARDYGYRGLESMSGWQSFIPMFIATGAGLLLFGFVTIQTIRGLIKDVKQ